MIATMLLTLALIGQSPEYEPGDHVILHNPGSQIPVVTNYLWADESLNLVRAKDEAGMLEMFKQGKMTLLDDGTEALVIQSMPVLLSGAGLNFIPVYEVRVKTKKYYVFSPYLITPAELAKEKQVEARKAAIMNKAIQKAAKQKLAKSTLTQAQRDAQIQKNLAKNKAH